MLFIMLSIMVLFSFSKADLIDFMDNFADEILNVGSDTEGKAIYNANKRHFITGGSFRYTVPNKRINLVSVSPPRISTGCGGISMTLGSVSALGFDYLVDKLQSVIKTAPLVAVNLVISNLSEKLASVTSYVEEISDVMNMINMDTCTLAKGAVGFTVKNIGLLGEYNRDKGGYSDVFEYQNKKQKDPESLKEDLRNYVEDRIEEITGTAGIYDCLEISDKDKRAECVSALAGEVSFIKGGVINYSLALAKVYDEPIFQTIGNIIRAYIGDVRFDPTKNVVEYIGGVCASRYKDVIQLDRSMESFLGANLDDKFYLASQDYTGVCSKINFINIYLKYEAAVRNIYQKIKKGDELEAKDYKLLSIVDIPIVYYFKSIARLDYIAPSDVSATISDNFVNQLASYFALKTFFLTLKTLSANIYSYVSKLIYLQNLEKEKGYFSKLDKLMRDINYLNNRLDEKYKKKYDKFFEKVKAADELFVKYLRENFIKSSYYYGR